MLASQIGFNIPMFSVFEPTIYRAVIDDVISAIKPEFDEFGVAEEVLAELQHVSLNFFFAISKVNTTISFSPSPFCAASEMGE